MNKRVGVLMGGVSSERKISLKSGQAVVSALHQSGCHVIPLDIVNKDKEKIISVLMDAKIDVAFIVLHGDFGEDGGIQSILDEMGIPYTGSGVEASRLAMNKVKTQQCLSQNNIPVPNFVDIVRGGRIDFDYIVNTLGDFSYVVKPATQGSSVGIAFVDNEQQLTEAIANSWQYGDQILIDQCIEGGREMTVGILNKKVLPVIEIRPKNKYFDFSAKYQKGRTDYIVPADISEEFSRQLQNMAENVHKIVGCRMFSRIDFIVDQNNKPYVLEINTIPGFTETSLLPKAALNAGISFEKLCLTLVELAYGTKKEIENITCHL